jgi:hypothetical protein
VRGVRSLIGAAALRFGGKGEKEEMVVGSRSLSMAQWTKSKSMDMEDKEIGLLFEQLWNMP